MPEVMCGWGGETKATAKAKARGKSKNGWLFEPIRSRPPHRPNSRGVGYPGTWSEVPLDAPPFGGLLRPGSSPTRLATLAQGDAVFRWREKPSLRMTLVFLLTFVFLLMTFVLY
jgi:hypothetical protein